MTQDQTSRWLAEEASAMGHEAHLARLSMRRLPVALVLVLILSYAGIEAHQDPCHRNHSCPSDHGTYVCEESRQRATPSGEGA